MSIGDKSEPSSGRVEASAVPDEKNRLALLTGAAGGIGSGVAKILATAGWTLALNDVDRSALDTITLPGSAPHKLFVADVGDDVAVEAMFGLVISHYGRCPDLLINNAGIQTWAPLLELDPSEWRRVINTNLTGTFLTTRQYALACREHQCAGNIINIGSGCNHQAFPNLVSYTASKGGVEMLTRSSALELGQYDIRVNCLAPGAIMTDRTDQETANYAASWEGLTPLGRVGTPEDVANVILLMSDPRSNYLTGQTIMVDGGLFSRAIWPENY